MKKLALALVCLVSVAFFASCTPEITNPEPSLAIMTGENYVYDGQTIDLGTSYAIGFRAASNSQTLKELKSFNINFKVTDLDGNEISTQDTTYAISGTEYVFDQRLTFNRDLHLIYKVAITATVADVDDKTNSTTIYLDVNQPEEPLTEVDFEWYRLGNTQSGLEEYGLYWDQNAKAPFAQIKPLPGVILYKFEDSSVWDEVMYPSQKEAVFSDGAVTASMYNHVDVNLQNGTYDDVIGTRMPDGTLHLIHVTSHRVGAQQTAGRPIYIYGQAK